MTKIHLIKMIIDYIDDKDLEDMSISPSQFINILNFATKHKILCDKDEFKYIMLDYDMIIIEVNNDEQLIIKEKDKSRSVLIEKRKLI